MCARGDCHGYALTKQMALLPAGHLNSHRNVGIDQAGCQAGVLSPRCPLQQLWVREAVAGTLDRGTIGPDTCCFWGKVRAGAACVGMDEGWQLGCPECVRAGRCMCGGSLCLCGHVRV